MAYLNCRYHEQEFPSEGEIVIGRISKVAELGVFIEMTEYDNLEGLIVVGELTRKRINNANKAVKTGKVEVAMVSRVDRKKRYIDLSRIKVSGEERSMCFQAHYKNKVAHNTMITIAQKLDLDLLDLYKNFGWPKARKYGALYNYFVEVLNNPSLVSGNEFEDAILEGIKLRFKVNKVKVISEIKIIYLKTKGIHAIKEALHESLKVDSAIEVNLVKPPIYSISKIDHSSERGVEVISQACEKIKRKILSLGGSFAVYTEPKVFGESKVLEKADNLSEEDLVSTDSTSR